MPVHILTGLLPWLLFNIILLFTGVSGLEPTVSSSAGELVSLPCNHHGSIGCSSTTWNWNSAGSPGAIELVARGVVIDKNQEIARRLRVGTDCSLHINNLTTADTGQYTCRLYHNDKDYTDVSVINLSILNTVSGLETTVYSSAGELVSHSYTTIFPAVSGSEPTLYSSAGELVSDSYTTIFHEEIKSNVWIGFGVAVCVAVILIVIFMICKRRTVQRKTAHNHVSQSHTVTDQTKGESEDTVTYAVVNPSAGGKRKQEQESAVLETEYAIIKTSQNSNKP